MNSIYEPAEDSNLLLDEIKKLNFKGKALDMGTGSGVIIKELLKKTSNVTGADINPIAVEHCRKEYPKVKFIQSDLFGNIKEKYDLITFNPPYLPADRMEDLETALITTGGTQGYELLIKFLKQAINHLTNQGIIITLFSTLTQPDIILNKAEELGYKSETLNTKKMFFETLYCVSFSLKKS